MLDCCNGLLQQVQSEKGESPSMSGWHASNAGGVTCGCAAGREWETWSWAGWGWVGWGCRVEG